MKLKFAAAMSALLSLAVAGPVVAVAKDGDDDPAGHVRHGRGADDGAVRRSADMPATTRTSATRTLRGTVGPGFTINLKLNGKKVKSLKPGRYKFVIADKSSVHNFELERESGAKFERDLTSVRFVGTRTITLTLKRGKWKYECEPHESTMRGFFTVR